MEKRRPQTASQYVLGVLRNEILDGVHSTGTHLRQEEVASRLGVSTTPVREAFRDLMSEGLVGTHTHRGVIVRGLTLDDAREVFEMKIALEPVLVVRAVHFSTEAHCRNADIFHKQLCHERDPAKWTALNVKFHETLYSAAPEGRMTNTVENLARAAEAYVNLSMHVLPQIMDDNNADHARILAAYVAKDEKALRTETRTHLEKNLRVIEEHARLPKRLPSLEVA